MPRHTMFGPLVLLTALLGWSTACPLTLQPPVLVQEFGASTSVNCTPTVDDHRGFYWTNGSEKQDMNSTVLQIPRIDWNTAANCTIQLNDTFGCGKQLEIKVYKRPTSVTVQSNGIKGNQLELKCDVRDVAVVQNLTVAWFKNNKTIVNTTSFFPPRANHTMSVTSSLIQTVQEAATFTCEASELGPHGPLFVSKDTWDISVPEFDVKTYNIHLNDSDEVTLRCEAMGNPPPHYRWIKDGNTVANNTNFFNISRGQVNENTTFDCVASNDLGSDKKTFFVAVTETTPPTPIEATTTTTTTAAAAAAPPPKSSDCPLTLAPDKILVKFGDPASANCSTTETDAEGLGWEATTDGIGLTNVTRLEWRVKKVKAWNIKAECFLTPQNGTQCNKPLDITIWKSPDKVQVSPKDTGSMEEGVPHRLKCDVFNVAPVETVQVKWYQDGNLVHTGRDNFNISNAPPDNVTSDWELTPKKDQNGANFTCEAELLLGQEHNPKVMSEPYTANVQYKPSATCLKNYAGRENDLLLDTVPCKADGNPAPDIYWYYKDKPVNSTEPLTRSDSGTYRAEFTNKVGKTSAAVDIIVEYGPLFSCKDHYNVTENVKIGSECEPEGIPKPKSVWFKDGKETDLPKMWKRLDSGVYSIIATNKHGRANHTLSINVLYIPRFSEEAITQKFNQGEDVTLECTADGNPPPQLHWKNPPAANVRVTTGGRHSYVHVTEATSSNAGLYSCTATNEVGSVSKNVTLMITGKTRTVHPIIFIVIALFVVLLICIGILIYRHYRKKSGRYDVIGFSDSLPLTPRL